MQWHATVVTLFVQGHNATLKKVCYLETFPAKRNIASDNYNELMMNLINKNFINHKGDHRSWGQF